MTSQVPPTPPSSSDARPRVVLLGASNLSLGLAEAIGAARSILGGPMDVLVAGGFGRSYGLETNVLGRRLTSIAESGLWAALSRGPARPTHALLCDEGNDILYGAPPALVAEWVRGALQRLDRAGARTVVALLPMASLARLGRLRYYVARSLLYPRCRFSHGTALGRARELDGHLRALAADFALAAVEPRAEWFGIDPIHLRPGARPTAWSAMFAPWGGDRRGVSPGPPGQTGPTERLGRVRPEAYAFLGRARRCAQPCARLADGSSISLY